MTTSWSYRLGNPQIISETIEGEAVIIDLDTGYYYGLDHVGSWIWQAVNAGKTETAIVAGAIAAFSGPPDEISAHARAFLDKLDAANTRPIDPRRSQAPQSNFRITF